ncbi:MIZ zinc finger family protein [Aphelenchoides avenae]|nr:MIZ zinc finger family protein [Aphelenchus avenae]
MIAGHYKQRRAAGIEVAVLRVRLKCPLTQRRIVVPARSVNCTHLQCFDLASYLRMQMTAEHPIWTCPICRMPADTGRLQIDEYVSKVLESERTQNAEVVTLLQDGTFEPVVPFQPSGVVTQEDLELVVDENSLNVEDIKPVIDRGYSASNDASADLARSDKPECVVDEPSAPAKRARWDATVTKVERIVQPASHVDLAETLQATHRKDGHHEKIDWCVVCKGLFFQDEQEHVSSDTHQETLKMKAGCDKLKISCANCSKGKSGTQFLFMHGIQPNVRRVSLAKNCEECRKKLVKAGEPPGESARIDLPEILRLVAEQELAAAEELKQKQQRAPLLLEAETKAREAIKKVREAKKKAIKMHCAVPAAALFIPFTHHLPIIRTSSMGPGYRLIPLPTRSDTRPIKEHFIRFKFEPSSCRVHQANFCPS